ncbi:hypothetical protein WJX72_012144 [[Myrmecia] bisecta]|uniref:Glycosyltransferase 61 catalytic domain-containing protein n=1 Tax=[Myrmecia] bisecta TaxID=41462 RepID=A0AAW1RA30_9CHLO
MSALKLPAFGIPCGTSQMTPDVKLDIQSFLDAAAGTMQQLGVSVSDECSSQVGMGFVEHWRSQQYPHCMPKEAQPINSSVVCHARDGSEVPFTICASQNAVIADSAGLVGPGTFGSVLLGCDAAGSAVPEDKWRDPNKRWFLGAARDKQYKDISQHCAAGDPANQIVAHPLFFLERYDPTNIFHFLEEIVTTFISLAVAGFDPGEGLQVVVIDGMQKGLYVEALERLSHPWPVRWMHAEPFAPNTCVRKALHNTHAGSSLLSYLGVGRPNTCHSVILQALSNWLRALFADAVQETPQLPLASGGSADASAGVSSRREAARSLLAQQNITAASMQDPSAFMQERSNAIRALLADPATQNTDVRDLTVLWISRQVFEHTHTLSGWQAGRILRNENDIVLHLQKVINEWNAGSCLLQSMDTQGNSQCRRTQTIFRLQTVELSSLTLVQQLSVTAKASILVGVHGAGLAHAAFMKPNHGAIVELRIGGTMGSWHYHNMAHHLGLHYKNLDLGGGTVLVEAISSAVAEMMDKIAE